MYIPGKIKYAVAFLLAIAISDFSIAQETVFSLFKTNDAKADQYFRDGQYKKAIELYNKHPEKQGDDDICLQLARAYHYVNDPVQADVWFKEVIGREKTLPVADMYLYAETLSALKSYDQAIEWYSLYLKKDPSDPRTIKKIWQLRNRKYLYEDSVHYTVKSLAINSLSGEFGAVPYQDGIIFISNRKRRSFIHSTDANGESFYKVYYSKRVTDTLQGPVTSRYDEPSLFCRELRAAFHEGPVTLYDYQNRMLYTATSSQKEKNKRVLQLYFAEQKDGKWRIVEPFPFNSTEYSIQDAAISKDEKTLYFSSDMKGGMGKKDLYRSTRVNNQWTKPVNLGEAINTSGDESLPFIDENNTLYFSSNGHAGLGGIDIFKAPVVENGFGEVTNIGYPVNTNFDDFGIYLEDEGTHGFFTSNRQNRNDDIYELDIDLQSYPLVVKGVLKYKEESWKDSTELKIFSHAQLYLIDNFKNASVSTTSTSDMGTFSLTVPYSSQYRIKVVDTRTGDEMFVGLELSKRKVTENIYEIVVVKNAFKGVVNPKTVK